MQKRFYILFVARGDDGQLRKIPIPVHYLYVFLVGAAIVGLSLTGIASSYLRMVLKVSHYNQLRTEKDDLKNRYSRLEQVAKERDIQVASLGSLAGEVSSLYGLKSDPNMVTASSEKVAHRSGGFFPGPARCAQSFGSDRRYHDRNFARPDSRCHHRRLAAGEFRSQSLAGRRSHYGIVSASASIRSTVKALSIAALISDPTTASP